MDLPVSMIARDYLFHTVYGRRLITGLAETAPTPYIVVTMEELWHNLKLKDELGGRDLAYVHFVDSLELNRLEELVRSLPEASSVIGIGGGRAMDVAKFIAWRKKLTLFQVPTIISTNAPFTHRCAVRIKGVVRYIGWAVPEVVYVDYDIIRSAPPYLNRAGVGDVFCIHTALYDWKLATERGKEKLWPWDEELASEARRVLQTVREKTREIYNVSNIGIKTLMEAHRWTGASYHNSGWNPRHIEGCEHFFFYTLEYLTGKAFIHGEPVCLGIVFISLLQGNDPEGIWKSIKEAGVRVCPEDMNITWTDAVKALKETRRYAEEHKLFYTTINERDVTDDIIENAKMYLYGSG